MTSLALFLPQTFANLRFIFILQSEGEMSFGQSSPSHETHLLNNFLFSLFLVFVFFRFLFASWSDLHTYTQTHTCSNTLSLTHTYTHTPSQTPIFISLQCSSLSLTQNLFSFHSCFLLLLFLTIALVSCPLLSLICFHISPMDTIRVFFQPREFRERLS